MPSTDQVPVNNTHSYMLWPMWVVLIARSTGTALCAVRPPNRYVTPGSLTRSHLRRECGGFSVAFVPGHHRPCHPGEFVGERDGGNLGGSPRQQCGEPGSMLRAVDLGIADHGERAGGEQAAQIAIALLADTAKLILAPARVLLRHEPDPGREVSSRSEGLGVGNARNQCRCERRTDAGDRVKPLARRV